MFYMSKNYSKIIIVIDVDNLFANVYFTDLIIKYFFNMK